MAKKTGENQERKTIELALQGGGAHGAITWGALDRILDDERIIIEGISGTSAGAMNAALIADGLSGESGGRKKAQKKLREFWKGVSDAARFSPIQRSFWDRWIGNWSLDHSPSYLMMDFMTRSFSPYELNPLDINPLRDLVAEIIDFDRVNSCDKTKIFVTATNVRSGTAHIFQQPELTAETLMASAALPYLYKAVEIDGEAYWDGGYTGNPALFPLVDDCKARDIVLIQINPFYREEIPKTAREITNRLNEITFNASLMKELRALMLLKEIIEGEKLEAEEFRRMRIHRIHTDRNVTNLSSSSKINAEWDYLVYLHDLGYKEADKFLTKHWDDIGTRSSFDLSYALQGSIRPVLRCAADIKDDTKDDAKDGKNDKTGGGKEKRKKTS
ncbi:MAG: patatin-like phospholipase family protein [Micavibrio sp.]|nr:MAG: patatin-like phospholipase family protein [Micavibrio sp.]